MYKTVFEHCNLPLATWPQLHLIHCHFFQSSNQLENWSDLTLLRSGEAKWISKRSQYPAPPLLHPTLELQNSNHLHNWGTTQHTISSMCTSAAARPGKCLFYVFIIYFWILAWFLQRSHCSSLLNICLCNLSPAANWVHVILYKEFQSHMLLLALFAALLALLLLAF